jgi:FkbM family methyltransferase
MKKIIKKLIHYCGLDVHRLSLSSNASAQLLAALNHVNADTVFDIGANIGQFAQELQSVGFKGKIISFEPLTSAHSLLVKAVKYNSSWVVHPRTAVGDEDGEIKINIAGNSVSSSVLPMLESHSTAALGSAYVSAEKTPIVRLDSVANQYLTPNSRPFIKIDTQGFEWQVLDGAVETIKVAQGVLLELSLTPLYGGQRLWLEMIERMDAIGFTLWAIQKGFTDPVTGRSLQIDAIFIRN